MKKIIATIAKAIINCVGNFLVFPIVFLFSFLIHFPYYLISNKNA